LHYVDNVFIVHVSKIVQHDLGRKIFELLLNKEKSISNNLPLSILDAPFYVQLGPKICWSVCNLCWDIYKMKGQSNKVLPTLFFSTFAQHFEMKTFLNATLEQALQIWSTTNKHKPSVLLTNSRIVSRLFCVRSSNNNSSTQFWELLRR